MDEIDRICKENNIHYYLFYGTLIGAVRHKGFIPWDDDIDICMPRKDYIEFEKLMMSAKHKVRFLTINTDKDYIHCFGKVCNKDTVVIEPGIKRMEKLGVFVDVFPLDYAPKNSLFRKVLKFRLYIPYKFRWLCSLEKYVPAKNKLSNVINYLGFIYSNRKKTHYYAKKVNVLAQKQHDQGLYINSTGLREVFPKSIFDKTLYTKFEDRVFPIPEGYDLLLRTLYGDYMTLPPVEKRHGGHGIVAYWRKGDKNTL